MPNKFTWGLVCNHMCIFACKSAYFFIYIGNILTKFYYRHHHHCIYHTLVHFMFASLLLFCYYAGFFLHRNKESPDIAFMLMSWSLANDSKVVINDFANFVNNPEPHMLNSALCLKTEIRLVLHGLLLLFSLWWSLWQWLLSLIRNFIPTVMKRIRFNNCFNTNTIISIHVENM